MIHSGAKIVGFGTFFNFTLMWTIEDRKDSLSPFFNIRDILNMKIL